MRVSTKTRYGLRFMIDLAQHWGEGPLSMRIIAERQGLSKKYLEQIASLLISNGLVHVSRGQTGGYELSRSPQEITMGDVVGATEGGLFILECLEHPDMCSRFETCASAQAWGGLQEAMVAFISSKTLAELAALETEPVGIPCV